MADISKLSRLINGVQRNVDLSANTIVVSSVKIGAGQTELTQAILDKLILINAAADADGTFDTRYTKISDLSSIVSGKGAGLVGINDAGSYFASATVEGALQELGSAIGTGSAADISYSNATSGLAATNVQSAIDEVEGRVDSVETLAAAAVPSSQKGAANGVATLDANGLVPITQMPPAALERLVVVADQTARFALTIATVQNGDTVKQTDTGEMWYVIDDTNLGNSAGYAVYTAGTASSVAWSGVTGTPTTLAGYGITDYAAAAKAAAVSDSITDGVTDVAPSQNAVFDALAGKQAANAALDEAVTFFGATDITGAEAETLTSGTQSADLLHAHGNIRQQIPAGETMDANSIFAVRYAKAADTGVAAGSVMKADKDATSVDNFYVVGIARNNTGSAITATNNILVFKAGSMTMTAHGFTVGEPLFLSSAGALTQTAPSAANEAVVRVGIIRDANTIEVQIQVMGVN